MAKITRRAPFIVSNVGLFAAALFVVTPLAGCGSSSNVGGPSGSGGGPVAGSGGHLGAGGGNATGGAVGSGGTSAGASGGNPGGTGTGGGSATGGAAGATTATGGSGNGGTTPKASGGTSVGGTSGGGKSGTGGMKIGGNSGSSGGAAGGHGGASSTGGSSTGGSGSGGSGSGGAGGTVSTATLLVDLANAFCTTARTCCAMAGMTTTLTDCETQFPSRLSGLSYVNDGTETIDNTALAACIAGYKSTATTCAFQPLYAACADVFVGTKNEGDACGKGGMPSTNGSGECKITGSATMCLWTGDANVSTTTGVCHTPAHGKAGDPCANTCWKNESCVFDLLTSPGYPTGVCFESDGLYCSSDTNPVCATIVPTGGSCQDKPFSCASTDYCDSTSGTGMCRTAATLGQACDDSAPNCVEGMSLECGTDNKCQDFGFAFSTTCGGTPTFP